MDLLQQLRTNLQAYLFIFVLIENAAVLGGYWWLQSNTRLGSTKAAVASAVLAGLLTLALAKLYSNFVIEPLKALWQAILHLSPSEHGIAPPKMESLRFGRELVTNLT